MADGIDRKAEGSIPQDFDVKDSRVIREDGVFHLEGGHCCANVREYALEGEFASRNLCLWL